MTMTNTRIATYNHSQTINWYRSMRITWSIQIHHSMPSSIFELDYYLWHWTIATTDDIDCIDCWNGWVCKNAIEKVTHTPFFINHTSILFKKCISVTTKLKAAVATKLGPILIYLQWNVRSSFGPKMHFFALLMCDNQLNCKEAMAVYSKEK